MGSQNKLAVTDRLASFGPADAIVQG